MATQVLAEPVSTFYKVEFKSGGDTTNQAFSKHIQEIERIYGYLKALDLGKVSASDVSGLSGSIGNISSQLQAHIDSTNPHLNYKPSVSWSDLTGTKPNLTDLNGNLPTSRIDGLASFVDGRIPSSSGGSGTGITSLLNVGATGYAKFGDIMMLQWGVCSLNLGNTATNVSFTKEFPTECWLVVGNTKSSNNSIDPSVTINSWTKTGFQATSHGDAYYGPGITYVYIAIGN